MPVRNVGIIYNVAGKPFFILYLALVPSKLLPAAL
jgi:hypothetical protein